MDHKDFDAWIQGYLKAWGSNQEADIAALFSVDATYLTQAFREPWQGREAIVKKWLERADLSDKLEDKWSFEYHWWAIESDTGVLEGVTQYPNRGGGEIYHNTWVVRLDAEGRCREFKEFWVRKPEEQ